MSAEPQGSLPESWTRVRFGDVVKQSGEKTDPEADGIERYVAGEHMDSDDLRIRRWGIVGDGYLGPAFHKRFRPGDVLYGSRRTYLRKVAVAEFDGVCANTTFVLTSQRDCLLQDFLPHVMSTEAFHAYSIGKSRGSTNPYVNYSDLVDYEFALPPLEEQKRIVDALTEWTSTIEAWEKSAQAADHSRIALLSALLSGESRQAALTDFVSLQLGRQRSPKYDVGARPVKYLRAANLKLGGIDFSDLNEMDFSEDEERRYSVQEGDVLLVEGGDADKVGAPCLVENLPDEALCIQNTVVRARPQSGAKAPPQWAYWVLLAMFVRGDFQALATGTKLYHLGVGKLENLTVPTPTRDSTLLVDALEALRVHERNNLEHIRHLRACRRVSREELLSGRQRDV